MPSPTKVIVKKSTRGKIKSLEDGITSADALERFSKLLTEFESTEISNFETVYTIGKIRVEDEAAYTTTTG